MVADVEEFLNELGVGNVVRRGREAFYSCPFEGHTHGDQNQSASMNLDTGVFHCFGCGTSGNQVTFLAELEGVSPIIAKRMIRERFGAPEELAPDAFLEKVKGHLASEPPGPPEPPRPILESHLTTRLVDWGKVQTEYARTGMMLEPFRYAMSRFGMDPTILSEWEFGYDHVSDMVCFPYRDAAGRLLGLKGRAWWPDAAPKYRVLGDRYGEEGGKYGFPTMDVSRAVFGLHRIPSIGSRMNRPVDLIVTEGELNAVAVWQKTAKYALGISGQYMSEEQARMVCDYADVAILIYDDLEKARMAAAQLPIMTRIVPPRGKDPMDATREELNSWIWHAVSSAKARML